MMQFADTFYYIALLNRKDRAHSVALKHSIGPGDILTTEWVLTELADAMAVRAKRQRFIDLHSVLRADRAVVIIPASTGLFAAGMKLYEKRLDKDWSLTDCISFVVMREHNIMDALTGDHHFEQAGFRALLSAE
jgi:predicted nucleic acid-binding protein